MRNSVLNIIAMLTCHGYHHELVFSIVNLLVMFLAPVGAPSRCVRNNANITFTLSSLIRESSASRCSSALTHYELMVITTHRTRPFSVFVKVPANCTQRVVHSRTPQSQESGRERLELQGGRIHGRDHFGPRIASYVRTGCPG